MNYIVGLSFRLYCVVLTVVGTFNLVLLACIEYLLCAVIRGRVSIVRGRSLARFAHRSIDRSNDVMQFYISRIAVEQKQNHTKIKRKERVMAGTHM